MHLLYLINNTNKMVNSKWKLMISSSFGVSPKGVYLNPAFSRALAKKPCQMNRNIN
jgi:hypothetical protein